MYSGQGQPSSSHLGATFTPGGMDDFSMPEVVSPAPQRSAPEEFHEIQGKLQHMELGADTIRPTSVQSTNYNLADTLTTSGARGGAPAMNSRQSNTGSYNSRTSSMGANYGAHEAPSFSPFPKLDPRPPNVPPSDDEKLSILENAKSKVIASNDPEIQLTWAQDTLNFVEISQQDEARRLGDNQRPATPRLEHELKQEALNIVGFLAEQYHPRAQFIKGMWLEFGKFGTRKDLRESYRCYARAAERGYARAEYRMGMQFEGSNDIQKAIQHYNIGVNQRDAASCYRIGMMTLLGQHGQNQDFDRGIDLIKYSADNADENAPQGAYIYGMLLARELPQVTIPDYTLSTDTNLARTYIEKAAFLGFAKAQMKLGKAYEHSELGCHFDAVLSLHYNNLAARQGDEDAEMAISKWFLSGQEGVFAKNEQMAFAYAQRAAKSGLPTAEFAMGYFNEVGIHTPVDLKEAQRWYRKAAESGNKDAAARVEGISRSKTLSRKDHERIAVAKVRDARATDQNPRLSSRMGGATPLITMPSVAPPNGTYPPNGAPYPPGGIYSTNPSYPPAGAPYPLQSPQAAAYPSQGAYGAYGQGAPPPQQQRPNPGPGGYGSPAPQQQQQQQHLGARPPYQSNGPPPPQNNGYPQRVASSTPQGLPNRRPVGGNNGPTPVQSPPQDFGYSAPPQQLNQRADYSNPNSYRPQPPTSRPDYPSNPPSPAPGAATGVNHRTLPGGGGPSKPIDSGRPSPNPAAGRQAQLPPKPAPPAKAQPPSRQQQQQPTPQATPQPGKKPRPTMQQGPSTFDEMGVPKVKEKQDCVSVDQ